MKQKPDQSFWNLWNLSFGFFGVQIAYALQSGNISRIFRTLGADPHSLSFFWILPPLMGILVQPVVGTLSDKTWTRFGRRIPYLFVGAAVAVAVMCLLPNAGSFGMSVGAALIFGLVALMLLDTSINMAMQPFKMLVGDMVNEKQKAKAYSIQSFLCNAGSVVGFLFPFVFTWIGLKNVAPEGVVPDSVIWSFYCGAAILIGRERRLCQLDHAAEERAVHLLEGGSRAVLLLGSNALYVDLCGGCRVRDCMGHHRSHHRCLSGGSQLDGCALCHPGHGLRRLGRQPTGRVCCMPFRPWAPSPGQWCCHASATRRWPIA